MTDQFNPKRFSRGVKLTKEHQFTPLDNIAAAAATAGGGIERTAEALGASRTTWVLPWAGPESVETGLPVSYWPFTMPPFQDLFDRATLEDPGYPLTLTEFSLGFDQKDEALAIAAAPSAGGYGNLSKSDMSRYDMTLRLLERTPTALSGDTSKATEVLRIEIPGAAAFGNRFRRANPLPVSNQRVTIKPFSVYVWELSCPGLFSAAASGVKDKWTFTINAGYAVGDVLRCLIDGLAYDYTIPAGPPLPAAVATSAQNVINGVAPPPPANPDYTATAVGDDVEVEANAVGTEKDVSMFFLSGAGTVRTEHTETMQEAVNHLALPSLTLSAVVLSPLTKRDKGGTNPLVASPAIQNFPTKHGGNRTGPTLTITTPAGDNPAITGTDIQTANAVIDTALRERAQSGYGAGYGACANPMQAADAPPTALLPKDSHYLMIAVPMWSGQRRNAILASDVTAAGLPFISAADPGGPWTNATADRRAFPVPENFVLHHAFVVWNNYAPQVTAALAPAHLAGTRSSQASYEQKVGVFLTTGLRSDSHVEQQVAYLAWTGANYTTWLVDEYNPVDLPTMGSVFDGYSLLAMPLVGDNAQVNPGSWVGSLVGGANDSGPPFYMGRGNSTTDTRTFAGTAIPGGGGGFAVPITQGRENMLEVIWTKQDATAAHGLPDPANATDVRIGQGGEWVLLCGKVTLSA